jgi:ParB family chromosome partitioning protein
MAAVLETNAFEEKTRIREGEPIMLIPIGRVLPNPNNPRGPVIPADCEEMAASIRSVGGILEPLIVTPHRSAYYIVAGHRRREAARLVGMPEVPCVIREMTLDQQVDVMLIENIQRRDLTPMQEARGFDMLQRLGAKRADLLRRTGLPPSYIDARLALLRLDPKVQRLFEAGELSPSAAKALAALERPEEQERFALMAVSKLLNVQQLDRAVRRHLNREPGPRRKLKKKMVGEEEMFTRTEALESLKRIGAVSFGTLGAAFNDVCEDTCQEGAGRELCQACPVPRFIVSVLRRVDAQNEDKAARR